MSTMDLLKVVSYEASSDASCLLTIDAVVPLTLRTYDRPMGSDIICLGEGDESLLEILVDPMRGVLRGITIKWFARFAHWPPMSLVETTEGLPLLSVPERGPRPTRTRLGVTFSVALRGHDVLVYWGDVFEARALVFADRVRWIVAKDRLTGVEFLGLEAHEVEALRAHTDSSAVTR